MDTASQMSTRFTFVLLLAGIIFCYGGPGSVYADTAINAPADYEETYAPFPVENYSPGDINSRIDQHIKQSRAYLSEGNHLQALSEIYSALGIAPEHPLLLQYAAHIHTARGSYILAEDFWSLLCEKYPQNDYYKACLGGLHFRQRNFPRARKTLTDILIRNPQNLPARYNLALVYLAEGNDARVQKYLKTRLSSDIGQLASWTADDNLLLLDLIGINGYRKLAAGILTGRPPPVKVETEDETEDSPADDGWMTWESPRITEKLRKTAKLLYKAAQADQTENWDDAIKYLKLARQNGVEAPALLQDIGYYSYQRGEKEKGVRFLSALHKRYPKDTYILTTLGMLTLMDGRYDDAIAQLKTATRLNPDDLEAQLGLACAYTHAGNENMAELCLKKLIHYQKKHPGIPIILKEEFTLVFENNPGLYALFNELSSLAKP